MKRGTRTSTLHLREYPARTKGRFELWDAELLGSYDTPPDAEIGIREYLGEPVTVELLRDKAVWDAMWIAKHSGGN